MCQTQAHRELKSTQQNKCVPWPMAMVHVSTFFLFCTCSASTYFTDGSAFAVFLLLFNAFVQIYLCLIINDSFTVPSIDSGVVAEMRRWRVDSRHELTFTDTLSPGPLVCFSACCLFWIRFCVARLVNRC